MQVRSRLSKEFCRHEGRCFPVDMFGVGLVRSFVDMKEDVFHYTGSELA